MDLLKEKVKAFLLSLSDEELKEIGVMRYSEFGTAPNDLEGIVHQTVVSLGIPSYDKIFPIIKESIIEGVKNFDSLKAVTTIFYPSVASKLGITTNQVQNAIKHAITISRKHSNKPILDEIFQKIPPNKNLSKKGFIILLVNYVKHRIS